MNEISQTVQREGLVTAGVEKIRTMIEGFDDISHGGMPLGRTTLVSGQEREKLYLPYNFSITELPILTKLECS